MLNTYYLGGPEQRLEGPEGQKPRTKGHLSIFRLRVFMNKIFTPKAFLTRVGAWISKRVLWRPLGCCAVPSVTHSARTLRESLLSCGPRRGVGARGPDEPGGRGVTWESERRGSHRAPAPGPLPTLVRTASPTALKTVFPAART